jgi:hypothetical protein
MITDRIQILAVREIYSLTTSLGKSSGLVRASQWRAVGTGNRKEDGSEDSRVLHFPGLLE